MKSIVNQAAQWAAVQAVQTAADMCDRCSLLDVSDPFSPPSQTTSGQTEHRHNVQSFVEGFKHNL